MFGVSGGSVIESASSNATISQRRMSSAVALDGDGRRLRVAEAVQELLCFTLGAEDVHCRVRPVPRDAGACPGGLRTAVPPDGDDEPPLVAQASDRGILA